MIEGIMSFIVSCTMQTVRVNPKRQRESLVLWPGGPVLRRTSQTGIKLKNTPLSRTASLGWEGGQTA